MRSGNREATEGHSKLTEVNLIVKTEQLGEKIIFRLIFFYFVEAKSVTTGNNPPPYIRFR
jgi:hypothetical protein